VGFYPFVPETAVAPVPWLPADNDLLGAIGDPYTISQATALTAGTVYITRLTMRVATTVTNLWFGLATVGSGTSSGSYAGLYSSAGVLLSGSADCASQFTTAIGGIEVPLTTPQAVAAGSFVWAAVMSNLASTQPTLFKGGTEFLFPSTGLPTTQSRSGVIGTTQTSLPASFTPSAIASNAGLNPWAGWS
jgi:hypothetical protein